MDCIIAAGGTIDEGDPLYPYSQGKPKALIAINGRTMLEHVAAALHDAASVDRLVIAGLGQSEVDGLQIQNPLTCLPDQGALVTNVRQAISWLRRERPPAEMILISTGDIPLLTSKIVDDFIARCAPYHNAIYYNMVTRKAMEQRFPRSTRTFTKLKGIEIAGGDLTLVRSSILDTDDSIWQALFDARKHAWQLARVIGPLTIVKLLLHQLSIPEIESLATRVVGVPVTILINPNPELAMDVDKPRHLELIQRSLSA
jgi:GTP:adenosylcobinamide-phosphate guanylyltransferase